MNMVGLTFKLLSVAVILLREDLRHRLNSSGAELRAHYDFIVVGSGAAGAVVAHRLAEDRRCYVLVVEAGPPSGVLNDIPAEYATLPRSEYDWNYTLAEQTVGLAFEKHKIPELKGFVLGGGTSINSMFFNRGNRRDYNEWADKFGAVGWHFQEVLKYFIKFENNTDPRVIANGYHGIDGPVQVSSFKNPDQILILYQHALAQMGYPVVELNGPGSQLGTGLLQSTIDSRGMRSSTANAYLDPNPFPHNLHITTRALVTRILFKEKTAIGVEFVRNGKTYSVKALKEVIVSAGAINSPQLLMLSGIGPADHLAEFGIKVLADLPVGRYLQNHVQINLNNLLSEEYQSLVQTGDPELTVDKLFEYYTNHRGMLTDSYCSFTYFSTQTNADTDWPNTAFQTRTQRFAADLDSYQLFRFTDRQEWNRYLSDFYGKNHVLTEVYLMRAKSHGRVRLQSNDPFVHPIIDPKFLTDGQDFDDFLEAVRFVFYFYERSSIARFFVGHRPIPGCQMCPNTRYVYECEPYIRCFITQIGASGNHAVGTCRMGDPRRTDTVVDPQLRVKGVNGLRVCDASVMPVIPNGNTMAPSIMIGEKCADMVKMDYINV